MVRAHGVSGHLIVAPSSDVAGRFAPGVELSLVAANAVVASVRVAGVWRHGDLLRLALDPPISREEAQALRGSVLEVERERVPPAPAGTYYQFELVGCRVCDRVRGDLGEVVDLLADGGGLLLVVEGPHGELPIPFVERFLERVDVAERTIATVLPEGLVEACASRS